MMCVHTHECMKSNGLCAKERSCEDKRGEKNSEGKREEGKTKLVGQSTGCPNRERRTWRKEGKGGQASCFPFFGIHHKNYRKKPAKKGILKKVPRLPCI